MANVFDPNDLKIVEQLKQDLRDLKKEFESLVGSVKAAQTAMGKHSKTQSDVKKKTKELAVVDGELIKLDNQLARAEAQLTNEYKQVQKAVLKKKEAVKQSNEELKKQAGITKKTGGLFKTMTKSLLTAGAAFISVGAAINGVIKFTKQAIKVNREFESSITDVITLLDKQQKIKYRDFIEQGAIDIAAEYGLEIKDVNKALFDAISAGIDVGDSIEFLRKNAVLAVGGVSDLGTAVDGVTNIMNAYGEEAGSVEEITSAMFAAQVEGKTNIQLLSSNIGKLAPIAAKSNIPLNELLITFAGMTKQLGSTEESATVVRQVISSLVKPSEEAEAIFDKLGIATGTTAVQNEGLLNKLLQVSAAAEGNADVLVDLIPNIRAFTGVSALSADTIAELETSITGLNDKEKSAALLQDAFNEKVATGENQSARLKAEYNKMLITLGGGESVFKKIGTAVRTELTGKVQDATSAINVLQEGSWADRIKLLFNGLFKSLTLLIKPFIILFEKISGKDLKFNFDTKTAEEKINKTVDIVVEGEKKLTDEQIKAEEERQKKLAAIKARAAELAAIKAVEEAKKTGTKLVEITLITGEKLKITEEQYTAFKASELEKRTAGYEDWLTNEIETASDWVDQQIANEKSITEKILEEEKNRTEIKQDEAKKQLEIEQAKEDVSNELKAAAGQIATERFNYNIDNELAEYQAANQAKQDILKDQLDKGAISEAQYEEKIAKLNKEARIKEAKAEKKKALFDIFVNTLIEVTKSLSNPAKAIAVGAIGAANAAVVAARQIPKFRHGTKAPLSQDTLATVSEGGKELGVLRDGSMFFTPEKQANMVLPEGTEIFPHYSKETQAALDGSTDIRVMEMMYSEQKKTTKAIEKLPIIINNTGYTDTFKNGSRSRLYRRLI